MDSPRIFRKLPDVRMRGFQDRAEVRVVLDLLESRMSPLPSETVDLHEATGRVLAEEVVAPISVPSFDRAAMDGFALRGQETFGAGLYNPLEFEVIGEALPARPFLRVIQPGEAVRIMTGAPVPEGADTVLPAEVAEENSGRLRVNEPVPPGRNVGRRGEDIETGTVVLRAGRVLRPQDVGVLASLGAAPIQVIRRPTVAVIITGDELLPCGASPRGFYIVDSNSVMLEALVRRDGGLPTIAPIIPDRREAVKEALLGTAADIILISGGSSVGQEDHAPRVLAEVGELAIHGVALRPASPAGLGFLKGRPVFLIPGNPVSCLCAYDLFTGRAIRRLGGRTMDLTYRNCILPLAHKIASVIGRVDYVRVQIHEGTVEPLATSGASMLSSTTRADGFVLISADSEGHAAGEKVQIFLYD